MHIRPANPEDAWSIAAVDVASWQAAYRGLMPDAYLDALPVPQRATDWQRCLYEHLGWRTDGHHQCDTDGGRELLALRYTWSLGAGTDGAQGDHP